VEATLDALAPSDFLACFAGDRAFERPGPAYLRRSDWHWAEVTAVGRAIHVGYTITLGDVTEFALEVEALAGSSRVAVVVLDLRQNGGGDNRTYRPLLESLQRLGSKSRLAVLTSRLTFSAAMQLIVELEQHTQAVFVGEPTGGSPNHYGDATKVELPNSGLNAFVATVAWKTAGESDDRLTRVPDIPVRQDSTAFFAGNDPVLDAAVAALA
jgi:C-terminal processing protease CtpA/Prc